MKTKKKLKSIEARRRMVCAEHGCPPVVRSCMGQITCVRCDAILGDTLMGSMDLAGYAIVGHNCTECQRVVGTLTRRQRRLIPADVLKAFQAVAE